MAVNLEENMAVLTKSDIVPSLIENSPWLDLIDEIKYQLMELSSEC
jgi:hypothetical protein